MENAFRLATGGSGRHGGRTGPNASARGLRADPSPTSKKVRALSWSPRLQNRELSPAARGNNPREFCRAPRSCTPRSWR
jgi:hypothetical protein